MDHVAIDLGGRESQICVRSEDGRVLEETRVPTTGIKKYLGTRPTSVVIVETCAEAFRIADEAQELGHHVKVVPASLARSLGVGSRGVKNDVRDARNLSEASCRISVMPSVHIPAASARERKAICGMREGLVKARTQLINTVRGWVRGQGVGVMKKGGAETYPKRVRDHYRSRRESSMPDFVERQLKAVEALNESISEADKQVEALAKGDPTCQLLMSMPGVGAVTAVRFASAIDDPHRFQSAHAVASYLGLTPGEDSSSDRKRLTSITKAGASAVRWTLIQAAWVARRCRKNDPMVQWALALELRRGRPIAVVALARKMAGILWAMWKTGRKYDRKYDPSKGAGLQPES
jgi:transposase